MTLQSPAPVPQPRPAAAGPERVLYESERTRVTRLRSSDGEGLIRKEPLGNDALRRIRQELRLLERLQTVPGVARLSPRRGPDEILMADDGGRTLAEVLADARAEAGGDVPAAERPAPFDPPTVIAMGERLARTVAAVHSAGVVHFDITPTNIILTPPDQAQGPPGLLLIDFHLAGTLAEDLTGVVRRQGLFGTLPYVAPEQSGRTAAVPDERADLYAIGAVLYELVTGRPPFATTDPLRMLRDVLTTVPVPPAARVPATPRPLSDIITRLLQKDPGARYQSAEGLAHDLALLGRRVAVGDGSPFALGERDFPRRLHAPTHLVGRDRELAALGDALREAVDGGPRGVLVLGPRGAGKTALAGVLRDAVAARGGWFVRGAFLAGEADPARTGVAQTLRGLGRMLLSSGAADVGRARSRILAALGADAAVLAELPEFAALLERQPVATANDAALGDPGQGNGAARARLHRVALDLLAAVVSPGRPLAILLDDLQWADASALEWLDGVLADDRLTGLLVLGCARDDDPDGSRPLTRAVERWRAQDRLPAVVQVGPLDPDGVRGLLAEMLRLPSERAAPLAQVVAERTMGIPLDTIDLVGALRQADVLRVTEDGWTFDIGAIRRFAAANDLSELVAARIAALPAPAGEVVDAVSCLGGDVPLPTLATATGLGERETLDRLAPVLDAGLAVVQDGAPASVRLASERVREAAESLLPPPARARLHLRLARNLAAAQGESARAGEQYLRCLDTAAHAGLDLTPDRAGEARTAAELLVTSAAGLKALHPDVAERYLTAAQSLLTAEAESDALVRRLRRHRHAVLYILGRLDEADTEYARIEQAETDPLGLYRPNCLQVASLTQRGRTEEAIELGLELLRRLGVLHELGLDIPHGTDAQAEVRAGLAEFTAWADGLDLRADLARPEPGTRVRATAELVKTLGIPAHLAHPSFGEWLILAAQRVWSAHGPCGPLLPALAGAPLLTIAHGQDYRGGSAVARHVVAVGDERGYEPATSLARHLRTVLALHWSDPLEDAVAQSQRAREGLLRGGEVLMACFTHYPSFEALFETATLDRCVDEAESALAFATRTDNSFATHSYLVFRQACLALQGRTAAPGSFDVPGSGGAAFTEDTFLTESEHDPAAQADLHVYRAVTAAIVGDTETLAAHATAARPLLPYVDTYYVRALAELVHGLALAHRLRAADADRPDHQAAADLDACVAWMRARATEAPTNFAHLALLLEAERARALGDLPGALRTFDAARDRAAACNRPWHQGLIAERAARCHVEAGLATTGRDLLAEAVRRYAAWGADGKVALLRAENPHLATPGARALPGTSGTYSPASSQVGVDQLDLLAALRASQALASETYFDRLRVRIGELIGTMTGATGVLLAVRDDEAQLWTVWDTAADTAGGTPLDEAADLIPLSAFSYCLRSAEVLLVRDATTDDRFAADPALAGAACCSLLVLPMLSQGALRAVLVLENRTVPGAFAADRVDTLQLLTGQLAVSLDNAQLYGSLERRVEERTAELASANQALEALSSTDALTGLPNRRVFDATLHAEWAEAVRCGRPLALAMIDVDRFKLYNDRYGHPAGDECLRQVAAALQHALRGRSDVVCRYGGEEFAIILPGLTLDDMRAVAERVRDRVAALALPHQDGEGGIVTISVGIAAVDPGTTGAPVPRDAAELLEAADAGLYEAKRSGRNAVRSAPPVG